MESMESNGAHYEFATIGTSYIKLNTATDAIERILGCFPYKNCGERSIIIPQKDVVFCHDAMMLHFLVPFSYE